MEEEGEGVVTFDLRSDEHQALALGRLALEDAQRQFAGGALLQRVSLGAPFPPRNCLRMTPRQGRAQRGEGKKAGLVLEIVPRRIDVDVNVRVQMDVLALRLILERISPPAILGKGRSTGLRRPRGPHVRFRPGPLAGRYFRETKILYCIRPKSCLKLDICHTSKAFSTKSSSERPSETPKS